MKATAFIVAILCAACGPRWATAQARPEKSRPVGVVLLSTGQVLRGTVTEEGGQALVTLGPGSQVRLPHEQIVCTGQTIEDVFEFQYRRLAAGDVAGRIALARWCLRTDLAADAGRLAVELMRLAPDDLRVRSLEQQLRQQAHHSPSATPASHAANIPPAAELKSVIDQLSPPAFDRYARQIQPMLVNHCSASGCHGVASKTEFQLLRPLTGVKLTQRMTQRNLHAVLAQIDREAPLESPIFAAATTPHATLTAPLLNEQADRQQIEALKDWLKAIARSQPEAKAPLELRPSNAVLLQPNEESGQVLPASHERAALPQAGRKGKSLGEDRPDRSARAGDEFNRQYFPQRFAPPSGASP